MIYINTFIGLELKNLLICKLKNWVVAICNDSTYIFTNLNKSYIEQMKLADDKELLISCKKWKRGKRGKRGKI